MNEKLGSIDAIENMATQRRLTSLDAGVEEDLTDREGYMTASQTDALCIRLSKIEGIQSEVLRMRMEKGKSTLLLVEQRIKATSEETKGDSMETFLYLAFSDGTKTKLERLYPDTELREWLIKLRTLASQKEKERKRKAMAERALDQGMDEQALVASLRQRLHEITGQPCFDDRPDSEAEEATKEEGMTEMQIRQEEQKYVAELLRGLMPERSDLLSIARQLLEPRSMHLCLKGQVEALKTNGEASCMDEDFKLRLERGAATMVSTCRRGIEMSSGSLSASLIAAHGESPMLLIPGAMGGNGGMGPQLARISTEESGLHEIRYTPEGSRICRVMIEDGAICWRGVALDFSLIIASQEGSGTIEIIDIPANEIMTKLIIMIIVNQGRPNLEEIEIETIRAKVERRRKNIKGMIIGGLVGLLLGCTIKIIKNYPTEQIGEGHALKARATLAVLDAASTPKIPEPPRPPTPEHEYVFQQANPDIIPPPFTNPLATIIVEAIEQERTKTGAARSAGINPIIACEYFYGGKFVPRGLWVPPQVDYNGPLVARFAVRGEKSNAMSGKGDESVYKWTTLPDAINELLDVDNLSDDAIVHWITTWLYERSFGVEIEKDRIVLVRERKGGQVQKVIYSGDIQTIRVPIFVKKDGQLREDEENQEVAMIDEDGDKVLKLLFGLSLKPGERSGGDESLGGEAGCDILVPIVISKDIVLKFTTVFGDTFVFTSEEIGAQIETYNERRREAEKSEFPTIANKDGTKETLSGAELIDLTDPHAKRIASVTTNDTMNDGEKAIRQALLIQASPYVGQYGTDKETPTALAILGADCNGKVNPWAALMAAEKIDFAIAYCEDKNSGAFHEMGAMPREVAEQVPFLSATSAYATWIPIELTAISDPGVVEEGVEIFALHTFTYSPYEDGTGGEWIVHEIREDPDNPGEIGLCKEIKRIEVLESQTL